MFFFIAFKKQFGQIHVIYFVGSNNHLYVPLFQPGFDYQFIECDGNYPQPTPFDESFSFNAGNVELNITSKETDYSLITHPNHTAILIYQIDVARQSSQPQKCYDNYNRRPKGGKLTRFNDNVFNNNVTIPAKDSTAINNETQLIQQLPTGLYSIEKQYDDGSVEQKVIVKGN